MAKNRTHISVKHDIISKANSTMLISISLAVFLVIFAIFAARALVDQSMYHSRVIEEKQNTLTTLEQNKAAADQLRQTYVAFATEPVNVIGGNPSGDGPRDGDNAKLVLDSLPSEYDYPALSSSIEKILLEGGYQIDSIGGSEDVSQTASNDGTAPTSSAPTQPVEVPYPFTINADTKSAVKLLKILELSIRPFYVNSLNISGFGDDLSMQMGVKTFYQPKTSLNVSTKVVQ